MAWEDLLQRPVNPNWLPEYLQQQAQMAQQRPLVQAQTQLALSKVAEAQRQAQQDQQFQTDVTSYLRDPTPQALSGLMSRYPDKAQDLQRAYSVHDDASRRADQGFFGSVYSAFQNKRPDLAINLLRQRRDADQAAGRDTTNDDSWIQAIEGKDEGAINTVKGAILAHLAAIDPDKFASTYGAVTKPEELKNVGPGSSLVDPVTGKAVYSAPFAPQYRTVGEGQSLVEVGGGDPASGVTGGDALSRMLPITLQAEGGGSLTNPKTSPKGARGPMQVMPGTGVSPGFGIKAMQDDSEEERARVGRDYLSAMLDRYGDPAKAWAAYNAGPGKVDAAVAKNGDNWLSAMPDETKKYVRKNMVALNSGGGAQPVGGGRVVAVGAAKAKPVKMTPQEVQAEGLNPSMVYYRDANGVPQPVQGQTKATTQLNEGQGKATGYLAAAVAAQRALNSVPGGSYEPSEVSNALFDLSNKNPIRRNLSQSARRVLYAQLSFANAVLRQQSGAAISKDEQAKMAMMLFPDPGDGPEVQADKRAQREAQLAALRAAAGPGSSSVPRILAPGAGSLPRPKTKAEAAALPPGTRFLSPNGQVMVRK